MENFLLCYDFCLGEYTFTLEDMFVLLELSWFGSSDVSFIKLTEKDEDIQKFFGELF